MRLQLGRAPALKSRLGKTNQLGFAAAIGPLRLGEPGKNVSTRDNVACKLKRVGVGQSIEAGRVASSRDEKRVLEGWESDGRLSRQVV